MNVVDVKVKSLNKEQEPPFGGVYLVLRSAERATIKPYSTEIIKTDIAIELPENVCAFVDPSLELRKSDITVQSPPMICGDFCRDGVNLILCNLSDKDFEVFPGMELADLIFVERVIPWFERLEENPTSSKEKKSESTEVKV